jgi:hypothetical protein
LLVLVAIAGWMVMSFFPGDWGHLVWESLGTLLWMPIELTHRCSIVHPYTAPPFGNLITEALRLFDFDNIAGLRIHLR